MERKEKYSKPLEQFYDKMKYRKSLVRRTVEKRFREFLKRKEDKENDL